MERDIPTQQRNPRKALEGVERRMATELALSRLAIEHHGDRTRQTAMVAAQYESMAPASSTARLEEDNDVVELPVMGARRVVRLKGLFQGTGEVGLLAGIRDRRHTAQETAKGETGPPVVVAVERTSPASHYCSILTADPSLRLWLRFWGSTILQLERPHECRLTLCLDITAHGMFT